MMRDSEDIQKEIDELLTLVERDEATYDEIDPFIDTLKWAMGDAHETTPPHQKQFG